MHLVMNGFALVGAIVVVWYGVRVVATGIDVTQRWLSARKGNPDAWKVPGE